MKLPIESIGHKIRMIRKERGFTLEIMANKTGLSKGLLSQVERGISQPSLDSLWKITKALEASIIHFFEDIDQKQVHVTKKAKRRQVVFPESSGTYALLSAGGSAKLGMLEVRLLPGQQVLDKFVQGEGEECFVVTAGRVTARFPDEEHVVEAGDSIAFDSTKVHSIENTGDEEAVLIWSVTTPQF
ncbi:helix-turn-helix transcriptional regulator [Brevibacillus composti]|uniref:Helix-turn-helix transcriptional regulator n=1 Tax=Brevibacillus composti TaxID=2796470 RepID=A0A7T5JPX1_9BACL|nr:XRE family transcriptional regulator [Brevibacillus composti]QQE75883.1 helix-turn-helix transcriptional regulator [Brevibacillus composti]QUO42909.1 helix-turn-helix transcriptional regulator [Brevibacillus composti]